jgi:hypothetical protein
MASDALLMQVHVDALAANLVWKAEQILHAAG